MRLADSQARNLDNSRSAAQLNAIAELNEAGIRTNHKVILVLETISDCREYLAAAVKRGQRRNWLRNIQGCES
jgi:hypothetical protein